MASLRREQGRSEKEKQKQKEKEKGPRAYYSFDRFLIMTYNILEISS